MMAFRLFGRSRSMIPLNTIDPVDIRASGWPSSAVSGHDQRNHINFGSKGPPHIINPELAQAGGRTIISSLF
jgi:hypothetical protein